MFRSVKSRVVAASVAATFLIGGGFELSTANADGGGHGGGTGKVFTGDNEGPCEIRTKPNKRNATNIIFELHTCSGDNWVPDVASADAQSKQIALATWQNLMEFCIEYPTLGDMLANGYGPDKPNSEQSHWKTGKYSGSIDGQSTEGFIQFARQPHETITVKGANDSTPTQGIMANEGWGFPEIGTLMRPHGSHGNPGDDPAMEMVHLYCMPSIEEAFQYNGPSNDELPGPEVLSAALERSRTGGIEAVSIGTAAMGVNAGTKGGVDKAASSATNEPARAATTRPKAQSPSDGASVSTAVRRGRITENGAGPRPHSAVANAPRARSASSGSATSKSVNQTEFMFAGTWTENRGDLLSEGKFQADSHHSANVGNSATYDFVGSSVDFYSTTDTHHGIVGISIDGGEEVLVDLYSPTRQLQQLMFSADDLGPGEHKITFRVTGKKNANASDVVVTLDRLDVS